MTIKLPETGWWTVGGHTVPMDDKNYIWRTAEDKEINVCDMETSHVKNCIVYLEQRIDDSGDDSFPGVACLSCSEWIDIFIAELERRKYTKSTVFRDAVQRVKDRKKVTVVIKEMECSECCGSGISTRTEHRCGPCKGEGKVKRKVRKV